MAATFPPPRWAVPGLIPEGLTILAGAPKLGKSWLSLAVCLDVANGTPVLGGIDADPGRTLYAALEDTPRRLQGRLHTMGALDVPEGFTTITELPTIPHATDLLDEHVAEYPDTRLVVLDVMAKVRPMTAAGQDRYEADYRVMGALKAFADRHGVAVIAVTHTRKMADSDVFNTVSGSTGLTGSADTTIVLHRPRGETDAILSVTGRDVFEAEYAVRFDTTTGRWNLVGDSLADAADAAATAKATAGIGDRSAEILAYVAKHPDGVKPKEVAEALDYPEARRYLARLAEQERITKDGRGVYKPLSQVSQCPNDKPLNWDKGTDGTPLTEGTTCTSCGEPLSYDDGTGLHPSCAEGW